MTEFKEYMYLIATTTMKNINARAELVLKYS